VATTTVGQAVFGSHLILGIGQASHKVAPTSFTIRPRALVTPTSGPPGATIRADGLGYGGSETVTLHWGSAGGPVLATATSSGKGTAVIAFRVPNSPAGQYLVYATGQRTGAIAIARFTVT
jgi:hypothetical protein